MNLILNSRVELGISSFIEFEFSAGVGTTCRYTLKGDLINIMLNSEKLQNPIAGKVPQLEPSWMNCSEKAARAAWFAINALNSRALALSFAEPA
jgi:hypothetical protein